MRNGGPDNSVLKSFFATLPTEKVIAHDVTKQKTYQGSAAHIHGFYSPRHLHWSLKYLYFLPSLRAKCGMLIRAETNVW